MSTKEQPVRAGADQAKESPVRDRENIQAVNRFVIETDWKKFWSRVTERTASEMDAYERARVKSLQTAAQHVFM